MLFKFKQQIYGHSAYSDVGSGPRDSDRSGLMLGTNCAEAMIVTVS